MPIHLPLFVVAAQTSLTPRQIVDRAISAMGGESVLYSVGAVRAHTFGHYYFVEQSERPEGPYFTGYDEGDERVDFVSGKVEFTGTARGLIYGNKPLNRKYVIEPGKSASGAMGGEVADAVQRLAVGPERVLIAAAQAKDLAGAPDETYQGVRQRVLTFHWGSVPVRLLLNPDTFLPTAVDTTAPRDGFYRPWGDVTFRNVYGNWEMEKGGLLFPTQWVTEWDGIRIRERSYTGVEIEAGAPSRSCPAPVVAKPLAPFEKFMARPIDVAPGIVQFQGNYNMAVVEQSDGLVVIEATTLPTYTDMILDEVARRYPKKRVKLVVTTSDAWPHFGGLRAVAARGIPILALDRNRPILSRFFAAPHAMDPDALARCGRKPRLNFVSTRTSVGRGENRAEVIPMHGEGGERMIAIYFPGRKLLYTSDLVQPSGKAGFYFPAYGQEVVKLVAREHLDVETLFGMHLTPRPWSDLLNYLKQVAG